LKFTLGWLNGFALDEAKEQWINFSSPSDFSKLKKEIEFHFNIRKFRLYYYDDDQQLMSCLDSDDWAEAVNLADVRKLKWNAIRKRDEKPKWLYDLHFVIKDAYMF